jgi:hypothetical protein
MEGNKVDRQSPKRVKLRWGRPRERITVYVHPDLVDQLGRAKVEQGQSYSESVDVALSKHFEETTH